MADTLQRNFTVPLMDIQHLNSLMRMHQPPMYILGLITVAERVAARPQVHAIPVFQPGRPLSYDAILFIPHIITIAI
ncbi:hypothetical protein D3C73_1449390 [compost metagenome]